MARPSELLHSGKSWKSKNVVGWTFFLKEKLDTLTQELIIDLNINQIVEEMYDLDDMVA